MRGKGKEKERDEGFVDVIAHGGKEWIRVYRYVLGPTPAPFEPIIVFICALIFVTVLQSYRSVLMAFDLVKRLHNY